MRNCTIPPLKKQKGGKPTTFSMQSTSPSFLDSVPRVLYHHGLDDGQFYLMHADDKGGHILIDDDYNITGIVDWEWAHTSSKFAAFNSPVMLLPVANFYDSVNDTGEDKPIFAQSPKNKGHPDLATIVRNGWALYRLQFCCGYNLVDWECFLGLFHLCRAINVDIVLEWMLGKRKLWTNTKMMFSLELMATIPN